MLTKRLGLCQVGQYIRPPRRRMLKCGLVIPLAMRRLGKRKRLQPNHLARVLRTVQRFGISLADTGIQDYLDPDLTDEENLAILERLTGRKLHRWTASRISAGIEAAKDHAEQAVQVNRKDTYNAGEIIAFKMRKSEWVRFQGVLFRSGLNQSEFI